MAKGKSLDELLKEGKISQEAYDALRGAPPKLSGKSGVPKLFKELLRDTSKGSSARALSENPESVRTINIEGFRICVYKNEAIIEFDKSDAGLYLVFFNKGEPKEEGVPEGARGRFLFYSGKEDLGSGYMHKDEFG